MILPSQEIQWLSENSIDPLIDVFSEENLRASSYDLTVGNEYYTGQNRTVSTLQSEPLKKNQSFCIPPHGVCFILSAECINLPKDVTAKVSLRMSHIYAGLVLTAQPPFDPGYRGKVIVMLHNLSSDPVHMKNGERMATMEFMRVEAIPEIKKVHRGVMDLEGQLTKPIISSLSEVSRRSDLAHDKVNWMAGQMLIFAALIVAVLAVPGFFSFSSLSDRLKAQEDKVEKIQNLEKIILKIEEYRKEMEKSSSIESFSSNAKGGV